MTVSLELRPVVVGSASTIMVTVRDTAGVGTAYTPTGTVGFTLGVGSDTISGSCTLAESVVGTATCSAATVTPTHVTGTHSITATYTATDDVHSGSNGGNTLTVNPRRSEEHTTELQSQ